MPKYYCDYCDTFLTHDSPSVRKTHCGGRKHKENVRFYYQKWLEEQAQTLIDSAAKVPKPALPQLGAQPQVPLLSTAGAVLASSFPPGVPPLAFPPGGPPLPFPPGLPPLSFPGGVVPPLLPAPGMRPPALRPTPTFPFPLPE